MLGNVVPRVLTFIDLFWFVGRCCCCRGCTFRFSPPALTARQDMRNGSLQLAAEFSICRTEKCTPGKFSSHLQFNRARSGSEIGTKCVSWTVQPVDGVQKVIKVLKIGGKCKHIGGNNRI